MCKHILNAQASIRAPCCKKWFDCAECHDEQQTTEPHVLVRTTEMAFLCKKCKKAFRKDMSTWDEADEYCPHCDNHFVRVRSTCCVRASAEGHPVDASVIEAKTPNAIIGVEGEDARVDNRSVPPFPPRSLLSLGLPDQRVERAHRMIKDERMKAGGKIDTSDLDEFLQQLD
ncbi:SPOSA6832_02547, partial [Sporobolomyces salmonicolor]